MPHAIRPERIFLTRVASKATNTTVAAAPTPNATSVVIASAPFTAHWDPAEREDPPAS